LFGAAAVCFLEVVCVVNNDDDVGGDYGECSIKDNNSVIQSTDF
jgi:hypothetical protein